MGYIQKRGKNELHDYSYAMAADIAGAIGDRLAALNVVLGRRNLSVKREKSQNGQGVETVVEVTLDYEFIDGDSDEILSVPSYGEGRDSGDKAPYKALTGALKYALIQTFLIATGDDPEEERCDHQPLSTNARRYKRSISAEQAQTLGDLIEQTGTDQAKVLEFYAVSKLEEMTADNYRKARIDSRFLLLGAARLPHVDCYPSSANLVKGGGGDGEATKHVDTQGVERGNWAALSSGWGLGAPPDVGRIYPGDGLSPQACAAGVASAVRAAAAAAAQAHI